MVLRGLDRRDQPHAAAKLGHLCGISAAHPGLCYYGLRGGRRTYCRREQYASSVGTSRRHTRACRDPAIPPRQYRRLADLHGFSPLVRAATVAAAASAERDAQRLAVALCAGACLRLDRAGMAEQPLVFP